MEVGSFKKWLIREQRLVREMAHMTLNPAVSIGGDQIDAIDFRFEDYPKNTEEEMNLIRKLLIDKPPFYGKLPGSSRYMVYNGDGLEIRMQPPFSFLELPDYWWTYAAGYHGDDLIKRPLKMRVYD